MSKKTLIAAAAGSAFAATLAAAPIATAAENPFALSGLASGYQVADNHGAKTQTETQTQTKTMEGKCGEGKCGADTKSQGDAKKAEPGKTGTEK